MNPGFTLPPGFDPTPIPYDLVLNLDETIAAAGSLQRSAQNDSGYLFCVHAIHGDMWTPTQITNGAEALTSYPREITAQPVSSASLPTINSFEAEMDIGNERMHSAPVRFGQLFGDPRRPAYRQIVLKPAANVRVTVYNRNAADFTGQGQIVLSGVRYRRTG